MNATDTFQFLWFADKTMKDIVVKRFLSHVFGSGASSCITSYTTRHLAECVKHLFPQNVWDAIRRRLYVDDGHGGGSTLPEALLLKKNLIDAMARGGFSLSKWKANHPALLHQEPGEPAPVVEDKMEKVLGVHWNPFQDNFCFVWDIEQFKLPARTPRELISVSSSLYDPNGFITPFIMLGRQFLQRAQKGRTSIGGILHMGFFDSIASQLPRAPLVGERRNHQRKEDPMALCGRRLFDRLWFSRLSQSGL